MLRTTFEPLENGFHFNNSNVEWRIAIFKSKAVCGGMVYSALDYWYNALPPPETASPPPLDTVLNDYLLDRQLDAHHFAMPRVIESVLFGDWDVLFANTVIEELPKIQASIQRGKPVPLLLVREHMLECHFVLAIACDIRPGTSTSRLHVYDPNQPDKIAGITVIPPRRTVELTNDENVTRGFMVDPTYRMKRPPVIPNPVPPAPIPLPPSPYLVEDGDTLHGLARRFYGYEQRWADLREANRWILGRDTGRLKAGQILTIPD